MASTWQMSDHDDSLAEQVLTSEPPLMISSHSVRIRLFYRIFTVTSIPEKTSPPFLSPPLTHLFPSCYDFHCFHWTIPYRGYYRVSADIGRTLDSTDRNLPRSISKITYSKPRPSPAVLSPLKAHCLPNMARQTSLDSERPIMAQSVGFPPFPPLDLLGGPLGLPHPAHI